MDLVSDNTARRGNISKFRRTRKQPLKIENDIRVLKYKKGSLDYRIHTFAKIVLSGDFENDYQKFFVIVL